jgi:DNA-directed RNA polymerase
MMAVRIGIRADGFCKGIQQWETLWQEDEGTYHVSFIP